MYFNTFVDEERIATFDFEWSHEEYDEQAEDYFTVDHCTEIEVSITREGREFNYEILDCGEDFDDRGFNQLDDYLDKNLWELWDAYEYQD